MKGTRPGAANEDVAVAAGDADVRALVRSGGVIAYATESCFGLGCDPRRLDAVARILAMKQRHFSKGLILVAEDFARFRPWVSGIPQAMQAEILASWPGPFTWLLPARDGVSRLLRGNHELIAVRVSAHPLVRRLCREVGCALVSTSANRASRPALRTAAAVAREFGREVDFVVPGRVGRSDRPSTIRHGLTGEVLR